MSRRPGVSTYPAAAMIPSRVVFGRPLASLNHPNNGSIYGLEEAEGIKASKMPIPYAC